MAGSMPSELDSLPPVSLLLMWGLVIPALLTFVVWEKQLCRERQSFWRSSSRMKASVIAVSVAYPIGIGLWIRHQLKKD